MNGSKWKGRNIVLDLAVSKNEFKEATGQDKKEEEEEKKKAAAKEQKGEKKDEEEGEEEGEEEEDEDDDDEEEEEEEEDPEIKKAANKKQFAGEDLTKTCFVRNLSYDITDKDLREFCETFGKVEMAKVRLSINGLSL